MSSKCTRISWFFVHSFLIANLCYGETARDPAEKPAVTFTESIDFLKEVRPILERSCIKCHGPEKQKGGLRLDRKSAMFKGGDNFGPAIVSGNSAESPLVRFAEGLEPDMKMPPKGEPLTPSEIRLIRAWIDQGARWADSESTETNSPGHWAFQPVIRPELPPDCAPIDYLVHKELKAQNIEFSPAANRRLLIRRISFDITGLPPTPEEIDTFVSDSRPDAYDHLVERLLASPQFGERWARHWLDVVRFAETNGFETNTPRPNAWRYRDYVIDSFNSDKPFDRFIHEQLAGDLLNSEVATGFIVGGAWDEVKSPDKVLTAQQRSDELHDMVSTTGSAFLGLTIGCARCHNHKFDPISHTDYHAIKACFAGVQHGELTLPITEKDQSQDEAADECRRQLAEIEFRLSALDTLPSAARLPIGSRHQSTVSASLNVERFQAVRAKRIRFTITQTSDAEPCIDELEVYGPLEPYRNLALASNGSRATASGVYPNSEIHRLEHINDGRLGNNRSWISNESGRGWVQLEFPKPVTLDRIIWSRDRQNKFTDRLPTSYYIESELESGDRVTIAFSDNRIPLKPGQKNLLKDGFDPGPDTERNRIDELLNTRAALISKLDALTKPPMAYAGRMVGPEPVFRLHRGDPMQPREPVSPGGLSHLPLEFRLHDANSGAERRMALAQWITAPANPLTARVIANRVWQYHFGEGLVGTPSDFGVNGARPSHPDLLDFLASELIANGWSLKHLHRLILRSATYRQTSTARPEALSKDAGTRLLWRFPPRRLEAESIRDAILHVSGKLDLRRGGPGFSTFKPNDNYVRVYDPLIEFGPLEWRRMVYMIKVRMQQDGVFGVFDCPDAGQIAPQRTRSTTPLQALNLLNSAFIFQQSGFFAERLRREAGDDPNLQVQRAFLLAFGRPAAPKESRAGVDLIGKHGLPLFCRAIFNANEFVFLY